jgi:hypothetical protein
LRRHRCRRWRTTRMGTRRCGCSMTRGTFGRRGPFARFAATVSRALRGR